jgi:hypothetical protein
MKIAIHTALDHKPNSDDKQAFKSLSTDFENVDITVQELAAHIGLGHSFCAQHTNRRAAKNFLCMEVLAVDIDDGWTLAEALEDGFIKQFATIVYPTPNHTETHNRFRVVFELPRAIKTGAEMTNAYQGIIRKFGGDEACKDPCRLFFGSKNFEPIVIGNVMPNDILTEIIQLGAEPRLNAESGDDGKAYVGASATRSGLNLANGQTVKTSKGEVMLVADLPKSTAVHCPMHLDRHASAFIVESRKQIKGVHCSKCCATFWPETIKQSDLWSFDFFDLDIPLNVIEYEEDPSNYLDDAAPPEYFTMDDRMVHSACDEKLVNIGVRPGLNLIRSPKGSGKSYQLKRLVELAKQMGFSVLLIGHRQSLMTALSKELGLNCYLDKFDKFDDAVPISKHFAICIDSIPRMLDLKIHKFNVVIIDESEQVFAHLTSDTLKAQRRKCFFMVQRYLKRARYVVACDADLSILTLATISKARDNAMPARFYINRHKQSGREIEMYESDDQLLGELINCVSAGGKYYVCSNSKSKADYIVKALEASVHRELKIQLITSDNSAQPSIKKFIENIKDEILMFDVLVCSPSMGTGIDITFPNNAMKIDGVFGFFVARVNTHFDIDQQLCRVRHPKTTKAYISSEKFTFEIEPDVIKRNCVEAGKITDVLIGYDEDDNETYADDDALLSLYAEVLSRNRASKNNLRKHFIDLKKYNGWTIKDVEFNEVDAVIGVDALKLAQEIAEAEYVDGICAAILLDDPFEIEKLSNADFLMPAERAALDRYWIEEFYGEDISPEIVSLDDHGRYRKKIRLLETYLRTDDLLIERDRQEQMDIAPDRQYLMKTKRLLFKLFQVAGLVDNMGHFIIGKRICGDDLDSFSAMCREHRHEIQDLFHISLRKDLNNKPMAQLGEFLKLIGCHWKAKPEKTEVEGKRIYYYMVDMASYELARKYAQMRIDKKGTIGLPTPTWYVTDGIKAFVAKKTMTRNLRRGRKT